MADETKRDSEATPKLDEVLSGISERLDTLSESVRSLHETVSSSAEDTTREAADEDKQKMLSLLERIWEALNTTQATEVAEETAEPVAETAERNDQPAIFAPLRRAAAAKLQGVLDATDTDASTKIMVEGAVNYLTRTLTKEQLRREEDDNTTADLTKPLSVLQSVVSTLPKEHPAFASVQTAIQLISGENASTPTPEVTPEDEVETSTEATESIEVTALKAELSELRSAIDNVQVVRGVARPITPMDPSSPFASDDYQNLEPSEKAGVLASMIAKGRPNETK